MTNDIPAPTKEATAVETQHQTDRPALRGKLAALREAVQNPAAPHPPDESLMETFAAWADRFTVWHLRLLALFDDPKGWFAARGRAFPAFLTSSLGGVLTEAYPELKSQRPFYDLIAKDLWQCGLLNTDGLHAMMSASGAEGSRTTEIGKKFLRYVMDAKPSR
jgi:hypothetical protein